MKAASYSIVFLLIFAQLVNGEGSGKKEVGFSVEDDNDPFVIDDVKRNGDFFDRLPKPTEELVSRLKHLEFQVGKQAYLFRNKQVKPQLICKTGTAHCTAESQAKHVECFQLGGNIESVSDQWPGGHWKCVVREWGTEKRFALTISKPKVTCNWVRFEHDFFVYRESCWLEYRLDRVKGGVGGIHELSSVTKVPREIDHVELGSVDFLHFSRQFVANTAGETIVPQLVCTGKACGEEHAPERVDCHQIKEGDWSCEAKGLSRFLRMSHSKVVCDSIPGSTMVRLSSCRLEYQIEPSDGNIVLWEFVETLSFEEGKKTAAVRGKKQTKYGQLKCVGGSAGCSNTTYVLPKHAVCFLHTKSKRGLGQDWHCDSIDISDKLAIVDPIVSCEPHKDGREFIVLDTCRLLYRYHIKGAIDFDIDGRERMIQMAAKYGPVVALVIILGLTLWYWGSENKNMTDVQTEQFNSRMRTLQAAENRQRKLQIEKKREREMFRLGLKPKEN